MKIRGIDMSVRLNDSDVDLIEFDTQCDGEKNVNCYIASQSGKASVLPCIFVAISYSCL